MSNESKYQREADTIRDLPKSKAQPQLRDTVPEQVGVYVGPRPLAPTADHRTIQIKPVVLASHVDPRRAPTELRLTPPPRPVKRSPAWLVPLGLVAIAIGAFLAARWSDAPAPVTEGPSAPLPVPLVSPAPPDVPKTVEASKPADVVTEDGTSARPAPPEVAFTSLPKAAPPPPSAPPRKKKRDPWLD